jgi:hypothetical protein
MKDPDVMCRGSDASRFAPRWMDGEWYAGVDNDVFLSASLAIAATTRIDDFIEDSRGCQPALRHSARAMWLAATCDRRRKRHVLRALTVELVPQLLGDDGGVISIRVPVRRDIDQPQVRWY